LSANARDASRVRPTQAVERTKTANSAVSPLTAVSVKRMTTSIQLFAVKVLPTGADGGHIYIRGRGELSDYGECDVYAYFCSKEEERTFERQFSGQSVVIQADAVEFTPGIGGSVREILSWRLI